MDVTPLIKTGQQIIQSYAGGRFKISGELHDGPVIVMPAGTIKWDIKSSTDDLKNLSIDDFQILTNQAAEIDVLLIGCGSSMQFCPPDLKKLLKDNGLPSDTMGTGAACRTYNVLMAEGRRVAAALLPT